MPPCLTKGMIGRATTRNKPEPKVGTLIGTKRDRLTSGRNRSKHH